MDTDLLDYLRPELSMSGIIRWWQKSTLVHAEPTQILVCRSDILKSTTRVLRRENFNFCKPFKVDFSGEDGDDLGGPKREFLQLLMSEMSTSIFQGQDDKKFFTHDLEKLSKRVYEECGKLLAFSLLHGGPGIPILHPVTYNTLVLGEFPEDIELPSVEHCIYDLEAREKIMLLQNAADQSAYEDAIQKVGDWCLEQTLAVHHYRSIEKRNELVEILIKNEIFYRVQTHEIIQFRNGMNKVGRFLDAVQLSPQAMRPLFVYDCKPLGFRDIRKMYRVEWSETGSNKEVEEKRAIYCLEAFLADCEGGTTEVTMEDVLSFWTGARRIPPLGFESELKVTFGETEQLPTAHTCGLVLNIWRGFQDPDKFQEALTKSIKWAGGFHLV